MSDIMSEAMQVIQRYAPRGFMPKIGLILGSGLSPIAEELTNAVSIPYQAIPGIPAGTVLGHASLLVMGYLQGVPVVCLRGRLHLYEGVSYEPIRILVRILKHMGCHTLVVTCAVGSMLAEAQAGDLMMITDHISLHPGNPLVGPNDESIGPRFVALEDAYDKGWQELMRTAAQRANITLYQGVYIATLGPSFETPAEIRAYKQWGADAVGMSVVPEVILARHCGLRVACLAAITNAASGMNQEKITHEGTLHYADIAARKMVKLIPSVIKDMNDAVV